MYVLYQSTMIEPHHSFAAAKAEDPTRVGHLTGPAGIVNGETTQEGLEVLDQGLGLMIPMET